MARGNEGMAGCLLRRLARGAGLRKAIAAICAAVVTWAILMACSPAAEAHQLYVFAYAQGNTIHGEAYFRGRIPAKGLPVEVVGPNGEELGRTQTDQQGKFVFEAQRQCDHRLVVKTADGHQAEFVVAAAELAGAGVREDSSENEPAPGAAPPQSRPSESSRPVADSAPSSRPAEPSPGLGVLSARIEALQSQVGALRQQLDDHEKAVRLRDLVGGIGYILGLAGVAFYFLGARRKQQSPSRPDQGSG